MLLSTLMTAVRGFAMGAADIVPGVSGGTIALVFGIYERLVTSVRAGSSALGNLLKGDLDGFRTWMKRVEWAFISAMNFFQSSFSARPNAKCPPGLALIRAASAAGSARARLMYSSISL